MSTMKNCNPNFREGFAHCMISEWLKTRVMRPLRCVPFYMRHVAPELELCPPERLVRNYYTFLNVTGLKRVS
ncbi:hypothetical protein AAVH_30254 [Aphelenchoides avenae]|nr:hypothetical protein AAVH_30254 [Aphelenchus avenae]